MTKRTLEDEIYDLLSDLAGVETWDINLRDHPGAWSAVESFLERLEGNRPYDEAIEAVRRGVNALPRYSFWLDTNGGGVVRVPDSTGAWIEWSACHQMFDLERVEALLAEMRSKLVIANAQNQAST